MEHNDQWAQRKNRKRRTVDLDYLQTAQKLGVDPNFWTSKEYFDRAGLVEETMPDGLIVVREEVDGRWVNVLPPLHPLLGICCYNVPVHGWIWSDFNEFFLDATPHKLDLEFIYNPLRFNDLSGHRWATFRKNSRKFPNLHPGCVYKDPEGTQTEEWLLEQMMVEWFRSLGEGAEIADPEVLMDYVKHGNHRKILFSAAGKPLGINCWDANWKYINFRYSICFPEPFLAEHMRLLFYTDPVIQGTGQLVNDGGCLDRPSLQFFKEKMNPVRVRIVWSWT